MLPGDEKVVATFVVIRYTSIIRW